MRFVTRSGTSYTVENGLITRDGDMPMENLTRFELDELIIDEPFDWVVEPEVGGRAVFHLHSAPANVESITTRIVEVIDDPDEVDQAISREVAEAIAAEELLAERRRQGWHRRQLATVS